MTSYGPIRVPGAITEERSISFMAGEQEHSAVHGAGSIQHLSARIMGHSVAQRHQPDTRSTPTAQRLRLALARLPTVASRKRSSMHKRFLGFLAITLSVSMSLLAQPAV